MFALPDQLGSYQMRLVAPTDKAQFISWIASDAWQDYWGDPDKEWQMIIDNQGKRVFTFIFADDERDIGYIQYWPYGCNRDYAKAMGAHYFHAFPDDAIGVDVSIGARADQSRGIGSAILRAFASALAEAGAPLITIDPDVSNARAIRAYEKAGFRKWRTFDDVSLMIWGDHFHLAPKA